MWLISAQKNLNANSFTAPLCWLTWMRMKQGHAWPTLGGDGPEKEARSYSGCRCGQKGSISSELLTSRGIHRPTTTKAKQLANLMLKILICITWFRIFLPIFNLVLGNYVPIAVLYLWLQLLAQSCRNGVVLLHMWVVIKHFIMIMLKVIFLIHVPSLTIMS